MNATPADAAVDAAEQTSELQIPVSPPEDCIRVTEDGGVLKHVLQEGSGETPVLHARCLVHFIGRCLPSGDVFLSTKDDSQAAEPYLVVAGRDTSVRETGLNLAVATMRPGERAAVYITDPSYGYGEKGSFSFPSVPPACQLVYEVEMLTWEPPSEGIDRRTMLYEERLEAAERRRKEGNALFAEGKLTEALGKYSMALSFCDEDFMLQLQGPHLDKAEAVTNPVFLNMAAVQLKTGDYAAAAHNATQVIMREPQSKETHLKALFRRAKARAAMGRTREALEDLHAAAALDPEDREVQRELVALKRIQKEEEKATEKLFKGSLGPPPKAKPRAELTNSSSAPTEQQQQQQQPGSTDLTSTAPTAPGAGSNSSRAPISSSSSSRSSSRGVGILQPLFALIALILGLLQRCLRFVVRASAAAQTR